MNATPSPSLTPAAPLEPRGLDAEDAGYFDEAADELPDEAQAVDAAPAVLASTAGVSDAQLAQWMDRIVERDERALMALYDATLSRVYGLVLRVVHRPALAEEVVEDTFFQVWRQAARFDAERGRALTWLLAMARSRAIDAVRREARFQHDTLDEDSAVQLMGEAAPADELLEAARGHTELHRALLSLNAQPRQLVALAFFRGLSHEEIASMTALPLGTVKSQIRRALASLRGLLEDGGWRRLMAS